MASTKISALTDGVTLEDTDRLPVARSPFGSGDNRYVSGEMIRNLVQSVVGRSLLTANETIYVRTAPATVTVSVASPAVVSWSSHGLSVNDPVVFSIPLNEGTCTMTNANPGVVSRTGHGFVAGDAIEFHTTGALPTNVVKRDTYYVLASGLTADAFTFAASPGGTAINTTAGAQTGTQRVRYADNIKIGTVTMTSANPGVFSTSGAHGLVANTPIRFETTGALPTNVNSGGSQHQIYFVLSSGLTATDFQIATTAGGTAINTTAGSPSGTHTLWRLDGAPTGLIMGAPYYVISTGFGANSFSISQTEGGSAVATTGTVISPLQAQTGNDDNDGSAATRAAAKLSIQDAYDTVAAYDWNGFTVTIEIAAGQYGQGCRDAVAASGLQLNMTPPWVGGGSLVINGAGAGSTVLRTRPQHTDLHRTETAAFPGDITFSNMRFYNPTFSCLFFDPIDVDVTLTNLDFFGGPTDDQYIIAQSAARIDCTGTINIFGRDLSIPSFVAAERTGTVVAITAATNFWDAPDFEQAVLNGGTITVFAVTAGTATGYKAKAGTVTEAVGLGRTAWPGTGITFSDGGGSYTYTDHDTPANSVTHSIYSTEGVDNAVNGVSLVNAVTADRPVITASGTDTDIGLRIKAKGTSTATSKVVVGDSNAGQVTFTQNFMVLGNTTSGLASFIESTGSSTAAPIMQTMGIDRGTSSIGLARFSATATPPHLFFAKSRNATAGSHTIVQSGDEVGQITFNASDGSDFEPVAGIHAVVDGTPGTDDMPGRVEISTTADGAQATTTRFVVKNDGGVILGTNGNSPGPGAIRTTPTAVGSLVAAATAGAGARAFVTDANATTFASVVAAGGSNGVPVYSDGTNWRIG